MATQHLPAGGPMLDVGFGRVNGRADNEVPEVAVDKTA